MQVFPKGNRSEGHPSSQLSTATLVELLFYHKSVEKLKLKDFQVSGNTRISAETVKGTE